MLINTKYLGLANKSSAQRVSFLYKRCSISCFGHELLKMLVNMLELSFYHHQVTFDCYNSDRIFVLLSLIKLVVDLIYVSF